MTLTDPAGDVAPARPSLTAVFRHRNYRLFFGGQLLSLMGTWMQIIAQGWLVYRLTDSPFALGLVSFASQGPVFFFAVLGGTIADRFERRHLLIACQAILCALAAMLTALTFTGLVTIEWIVALALVFGLVNAVEIPARQAFTVDMVGKADLQGAIALNSMMFNLARVVGPAAAGIIVAAVGEAWCFALNAVSYGAVLAALVLMQVAPIVRGAPKRALDELREGFAYVIRHREIRAGLLALAVSSFAGGPYLALMPVIARDVLHLDSDGFGLLWSGVGTGALIGAFAMSRISPAQLRGAPALAAIGFGIALIAFSQSTIFALSLALIVPTAFALMLQGSATNAIVQSLVEDRMRGRVMAYFTMSFLGMLPFGSLAAGALAHEIGAPMTLALGGAVSAVGGILAMRLRPPATG